MEDIPNSNRFTLNDIKSKDIYSLNGRNEPLTLSDAISCYGSISKEMLTYKEPLLKKSNLKCRSILRKMSQNKSPSSLPALEEDKCYLPSLPMYEQEDFNDSDSDDSSLEVLDDDESWVDLSSAALPASSESITQPPSSLSRAFSSASPVITTMAEAPQKEPRSPGRGTPPPFGNGEEYLRLLREAQRESNTSSARVSLASSRRNTPRETPKESPSPKSPPNSPNTEMVAEMDETALKGVYINYYNKDGDFMTVEKNVETDWIWDWSSRPDQTPPKEWRFVHRGGVSATDLRGAVVLTNKPLGGRGASVRRLMVGNSPLFSREVLYTLFFTNVISLLLGAGIGVWLSKRSGGNNIAWGTISLN